MSNKTKSKPPPAQKLAPAPLITLHITADACTGMLHRFPTHFLFISIYSMPQCFSAPLPQVKPPFQTKLCLYSKWKLEDWQSKSWARKDSCGFGRCNEVNDLIAVSMEMKFPLFLPFSSLYIMHGLFKEAIYHLFLCWCCRNCCIIINFKDKCCLHICKSLHPPHLWPLTMQELLLLVLIITYGSCPPW